MKTIAACFLIVFAMSGAAAKAQGLIDADTIALQKPEDFCNHLSAQIRYPALDRELGISGLVIAVFSTDADSQLQYLKIVRSFSNTASQEVFNQIKNAVALKKMGKGNWVLPVCFSLFLRNGDKTETEVAPNPKGLTTAATGLGGLQKFIYNPNNITEFKDPKVLKGIMVRGYVKPLRY